MRVLFYYLLVLNLLYAGWENFQPVYNHAGLPPLADDLATLELLNESADALNGVFLAQVPEGDAVSTVNEIEADEINQLPLKAAALACFTLGPFRDEGIMRQTRESMAEFVKDIDVRVLEESEKHRYWVYVPSLPNRKQANEVARRLKESNLKDLYVVLSGAAKNSISLGHFREPVFANNRVKRVNELGIDASIEVIYKKYNVYWVDYRVAKEDADAEALINNLVSEEVSRINRICE